MINQVFMSHDLGQVNFAMGPGTWPCPHAELPGPKDKRAKRRKAAGDGLRGNKHPSLSEHLPYLCKLKKKSN